MEAMLAERGLLWAFLPTIFLGQNPESTLFPGETEEEEETSQRQSAKESGKTESRSEPQAPWGQATGGGPTWLRAGTELPLSWPPGPLCPRLVLSEGGQRQLLLGENGLGI